MANKIVFPVVSGKEFACNTGDPASIPGSGRSPGEGNGNPLQYACLESPIDRGAWRAAAHRVAKELDTTYRLHNNNNAQTSAYSPF